MVRQRAIHSGFKKTQRELIVRSAQSFPDVKHAAHGQNTLGNPNASPDEILAVTNLMRELGAIAYTQSLARQYIEEALENLATVPDSEYKDLLQLWAEYLIEREF